MHKYTHNMQTHTHTHTLHTHTQHTHTLTHTQHTRTHTYTTHTHTLAIFYNKCMYSYTVTIKAMQLSNQLKGNYIYVAIESYMCN